MRYKNILALYSWMLLIASMFAFVACNGAGVATMVQASGRPAEVMLVMGAEDLQSTEAYRLIELLEQPAPALPQEEQSLQVTSRVAHEHFNSIMLRARNILIVNIDKERYSKVSLKVAYDEWAKGQFILTINSPSRAMLRTYLEQEQELLRNLFVRHELYRFALSVEERYSMRAKHLVDSLFAHHINVPVDINKHKIAKGFLWMSNAVMHARHDLMVYTYPYTQAKDLYIDRLIAVRDSVLRENIPGGVQGSHPTTVKTGLVFRYMKLPNMPQRAELRGLWEMAGGDMMGGPFVLQAYHNESDGLVYVCESFVYRPNQDKLNMLRMMEACLYSFRPDTVKPFEAKRILSAKYSKSF